MFGISGANGFLGRALVDSLGANNMRSFGRQKSTCVEHVNFDLAHSDALNSNSLIGVDCFFHCAARVHVMEESAEEALPKFQQLNVDATLGLASKCVEAGVSRFVFISSIKVNGEETSKDQLFSRKSKPKPQDPYGQSKMEAELALLEIGRSSGMEIVIIRPPLIYGPGVKANFRKLLKLIDKGIPLPLGGVSNLRSLVGLNNLVDLIVTCSRHPAAVNQVFLVSDNDDVSTPELVRRIGKSFNKKIRLLFIPESVLRLAGKVTGKSEQVQRLCSSLQVDIAHTMQMLDWKPPFSMQAQLDETVKDFKRRPR
ncbi:MAG: SDR family oxidoreductase [Idiomarina sp.]|nr:SDR family oxidoreductase [Idiomarina sp.]